MKTESKACFEETSAKHWNEKIRKMAYKVMNHQKKWGLREQKPKFAFSENDKLTMKKIKHSLPMGKFFNLWNSLEESKIKAELAEQMLELDSITPLFTETVRLILVWDKSGVKVKIQFKNGFCVLKKTEGSLDERMKLTPQQHLEFKQEIEETKLKNLFEDEQETLYQERKLVDKIMERKTEPLEKMIEELLEEGYEEIFESVKSELKETNQDRWIQTNQKLNEV